MRQIGWRGALRNAIVWGERVLTEYRDRTYAASGAHAVRDGATGQRWLAEDVVSDALGRAFERWNGIAAMAHPHAYVKGEWWSTSTCPGGDGCSVARDADLREHGADVTDGTDEHAERDA